MGWWERAEGWHGRVGRGEGRCVLAQVLPRVNCVTREEQSQVRGGTNLEGGETRERKERKGRRGESYSRELRIQ